VIFSVSASLFSRTRTTHPPTNTHSRRPTSPASKSTPLQTRHARAERNPPLPALHRPPATQTTLFPSREWLPPFALPCPALPCPALLLALLYHPFLLSYLAFTSVSELTNKTPPGPRNRPLPRPLQRRIHALAVASHPGATGSRRGLHGASVRGHQSLRHPRQARHDHAEGYSAGQEDSGRLGRAGVGWLTTYYGLWAERTFSLCIGMGVGCVVGRRRVMGRSRREGPEGSQQQKMYCCCWVSFYWRSILSS